MTVWFRPHFSADSLLCYKIIFSYSLETRLPWGALSRQHVVAIRHRFGTDSVGCGGATHVGILLQKDLVTAAQEPWEERWQ